MDYAIGIDIGSTCAKTAVLAADGSFALLSARPTGWSSVDTAESIRPGTKNQCFSGTLEEISEVMSRVALHKLVAPCILYNLDGYYEGLRAQLTHMVKMGLCTPEKLENIHFAADLAEIKTILAKK